MDPFRYCIALGPLGVYLFVIGLVNLSRRSRVVGGGRDLTALGIALSGLVFVGPFELLLPLEPWNPLGRYAWLIALVVYGLGLSLAVLSSRPRLTIYNVADPVLHAALGHAVDSLDPAARWIGNHLLLPNLDLELYIEPHNLLRCISVVATHEEQNLASWRQLEKALVNELQRIDRPRAPWGAALVMVALAIFASITWDLTMHTDAITQGFFDLLQIE